MKLSNTKFSTSSLFTLISFASLGLLWSCSGPLDSSKSINAGKLFDEVPFNLKYQAEGLQLSHSEVESLNLATVATNIYVSVSGCASGYTLSSTLMTNAFVRLFNGDEGCLVKLEQFNFGSIVYSATGTNAVPFTNWLANDIATFENTSDDTDVIKVYVTAQVTQGGVTNGDSITYLFTDFKEGTSSALPQVDITTSAGLTVGGAEVPTFSITESRLLSMNANGTANMSFTLECDSAMTGSSNPTYACDSALLQDDLDYVLVHDTYSGGSLTVDNANDAFAGSPVSIGSLIVAPGGNDLDGNTLTNGGFYSSNASPLISTGGAIFPSNLSHVLIIRRQDSNNDTTGYLYFYVTIASITQEASEVSGCGTTFAGGAGTVGDPFQINSRTYLENTVNCNASTYYFILTDNIALGGSGSPWTPIDLYGNLDGDNYSISGLYISDTTPADEEKIALFGTAHANSSISDLTLSSPSITGSDGYIAPLVGDSDASISNVTIDGGTVTTSALTAGQGYYFHMSGAIAHQDASTVTEVHSSADLTYVSGTATAGNTGEFFIGGVVGWLNYSTTSLTNSSFTGTITTTDVLSDDSGYIYLFMGGLVGRSDTSFSDSFVNATLSVTETTISSNHLINYGMVQGAGSNATTNRCFAGGTLNYTAPTSTGNDIAIGGFVGWAEDGYIRDSYSMVTMNVSSVGGSAYYGGFVGDAVNNSYERLYSANPSMTLTNGSGFTGDSGMDCFTGDCYLYDNGSVPSESHSDVTTYTTVTQMQTQGNFAFDFSTPIWKMPTANALAPGGLLSPVLNWQCGSNGITCP